MHANETWIQMFRRIPAELHDGLALGLTTGSEIVVQRIVKLEPAFMIIRGRLAGTQDSGRIVLIPYEQLTFVALTKVLNDLEVESIFGKGAPPPLPDLPDFAVGFEPEPVPELATVNEAPAEVKKPAAISKTVLLAKLRDRLK